MKTESSPSNDLRAPTTSVGAQLEDPAAGQERKALWYVAGGGVFLAVLCVPFMGASAVPHVLLGTLISVANLWLVTRTVQALLAGQFQLSIGAMGLFKLVALMVGLYALFQAGWINGMPLLIGLAALPIGIVMMQLAPVPPAHVQIAPLKTVNKDSSSART